MLFNSPEFLFLYLPVLLLVFFLLARSSQRWAAAWLTAGSLFFYAWWNPASVWLLLGSIVFNYTAGNALVRLGEGQAAPRRLWLVLSVAANLGLLAYFKYAHFFAGAVNTALGTTYGFADVLLPLGISFFTFTQIAFLVDCARGKAQEADFIHYCLFVTYFPHLIAGPVLHHREMMPQFARSGTYRFSVEHFTVGLTIFSLGLFKKVVLADGVAPYGTAVFASAAQGEAVALFQAWGGALAYTLQLYFDFSGYSDMAIGLSWMLGVQLPLNFNSPYKATSIADFWRRWHMTLSRFLRDYLYIPLGGSKKGAVRRYANLLVTMLLGGLWHGAGWTFVIWGGLHGLALVAHQGWRSVRQRAGQDLTRSGRFGRAASMAATFVFVVVGWVFFRADTVDAALAILGGMAGMHGTSLPEVLGQRLAALAPWAVLHGVGFTPGGGREFVMTWVWIGTLLPIVFLAPNTQQIMQRMRPVPDQPNADVPLNAPSPHAYGWQANGRWALVMSIVLAMGLLSLARPSEFLYFQF